MQPVFLEKRIKLIKTVFYLKPLLFVYVPLLQQKTSISSRHNFLPFWYIFSWEAVFSRSISVILNKMQRSGRGKSLDAKIFIIQYPPPLFYSTTVVVELKSLIVVLDAHHVVSLWKKYVIGVLKVKLLRALLTWWT